jgi:biopolymer transport protein ExbD
MGKIKLHKKPPRIDMTPMVDLFFLLLIFFILTATFRPQEAVSVDTPNSTSNVPTPDRHILTLTISKENVVFFNTDNGEDSSEHLRGKILQSVGGHYNITFTPAEISMFEARNSFSLPIDKMKAWLDEKDSKVRDALNTGIPMDSIDNQLLIWIRYARQWYPDFEVAIKGDRDADYKQVKKVIDILQDNNVNKFNLTTNLESAKVSLDNL